MSEQELEKLIEKNLSSRSVSKQTGIRVAEEIKKIAERENIEFAIAGGLAMHLYGFERATKDVDFLSNRRLPLNVKRHLSFGGERYEIEISGEKIDVDWIIRRDVYKEFYQKALAEAIVVEGLKILTPEWLVILKYIAGRAKDEIDMLWLLQQGNLVKRRLVRKKIMEVAGAMQGDLIFREIERRYFPLATKRNNGDENESYIPDEDEYPEYNE
ncbi:MAG: hypothetical protein ACR2F2_12530 [Pyrinomonadaceae bacterium]